MSEFAWGLATMGYLTAAVFFLRFWSRTADRLFAAFAAAFLLLAISQALLAFLSVTREEQTWIYLVRLAAFIIIIAAIVGKNTGRRKR